MLHPYGAVKVKWGWEWGTAVKSRLELGCKSLNRARLGFNFKMLDWARLELRYKSLYRAQLGLRDKRLNGRNSTVKS